MFSNIRKAIRRRRRLSIASRLMLSSRVPFLVWVPAVVLVLGVAVTTLIAYLGVLELKRQSDDASALQSRAIASTLAERLSAEPARRRSELMSAAASRTEAELVLATSEGDVVYDASGSAPSRVGLAQLVVVGAGETSTGRGRVRFHAQPLRPPDDHLVVLSFVLAPEQPEATESLLKLVGLFALVLVGVGALVAYALARAVKSDVTYVTQRIVEMAEPDAGPAGKPVPVRTLDQTGFLTSAFNDLVRRFNEAEDAYKRDLQGALAYERERSDFLAALSHELRTPLNVILGFTDVLLSEVDGPLSADARENLEVVRTSGNHLRTLIADILDLSALESGELRLARHRCDVMQIAAEVTRESRIAAEQKGLSLDLLGTAAFAEVDPVRVRQIISNLVGNAVKFTSRGRVGVFVTREEDDVTITVSDTGPGIAEAEQAAIFEEYQQAGDPRKRTAGTGLGLAIARRLVKMHGGRIELESRLGEGSRFTVYLRAHAPPEPEPPPRSSAAHLPPRPPSLGNTPVPSSRSRQETPVPSSRRPQETVEEE